MNTHIVPDTPETEVIAVEGRGADEVLVEVDVMQDRGHEVVVIDIVDIEECGRDNHPPPHAHRYKVKIDHNYFVFDRRIVTGRELLERAGKTPVTKYELEKRMHGGHYVAIGLEEKVDLGQHGIEVFETFPLDETEG